MKADELPNDLMTIPEVCQEAGIPKTAIYAMVRRKKVPHYRIGKHIRFSRAQIESLLSRPKFVFVPAVAA